MSTICQILIGGVYGVNVGFQYDVYMGVCEVPIGFLNSFSRHSTKCLQYCDRTYVGSGRLDVYRISVGIQNMSAGC